MQWKQATALPKAYGELDVQLCEPEAFKECDIVFSGLDSDVAGRVEMDFLKANLAVFSNAKNYRQDVSLSPLILLAIQLTFRRSHSSLLSYPLSISRILI